VPQTDDRLPQFRDTGAALLWALTEIVSAPALAAERRSSDGKNEMNQKSKLAPRLTATPRPKPTDERSLHNG